MQEKGLQLNILQGGEEDREEEMQSKQIQGKSSTISSPMLYFLTWVL
jgi:hypothetical protein